MFVTLTESRLMMEKLHDLCCFLLHRVTGSCLLLSHGLAYSKNLQVLEFREEKDIHMMGGIQSPTTHRIQHLNKHTSRLSSHIMIMIISFIREINETCIF
jgi:hypothetical protein